MSMLSSFHLVIFSNRSLDEGLYTSILKILLCFVACIVLVFPVIKQQLILAVGVCRVARVIHTSAYLRMNSSNNQLISLVVGFWIARGTGGVTKLIMQNHGKIKALLSAALQVVVWLLLIWNILLIFTNFNVFFCTTNGTYHYTSKDLTHKWYVTSMLQFIHTSFPNPWLPFREGEGVGAGGMQIISFFDCLRLGGGRDRGLVFQFLDPPLGVLWNPCR